MNVTVFGAGYVGLVTAACLAEMGHDVRTVDKDPDVVAALTRGQLHIYEPGLAELVERHVAGGRLSFTSDSAAAIDGSEIIFICVGTPTRPDGSPDLSQVEEVARTVTAACNHQVLVVEKSTVPVHTADSIKRTIELFSDGAGLCEVASNPEFLREGTAIQDFLNPDRIVIGVASEWARDRLLSLYQGIDTRIMVTDVKTAEIIKHASNSFLATKISFINMISDICDRTGADVRMVAEGMGLDRRISPDFLSAGLGYGGSCFPKDLGAFVSIAEKLGADFSLLKEVQSINERRIDNVVEKLRTSLWVLTGKTVTLLGLAFKPGTDDIRDAPAIKLIERLAAEGATLHLYDPQAAENVKRYLGESGSGGAAITHGTSTGTTAVGASPTAGVAQDGLRFFDSPYDALAGAHAAVLVTEWPELLGLDLNRAREAMETNVLIDGRNALDPVAARAAGFQYVGMGAGHE